MTNSIPEAKQALRTHYRNLRRTLQRDIDLTPLIEQLAPYRHILSYAPFKDELDIWPLNQLLAQEQRLLLPKVVDHHLECYKVTHIENQLKPSSFGIQEPISSTCDKLPYESIDCLLVPAIAFDANHNRLGYGKGYYDRLLRYTHNATTIGLAYREQLHPTPLPIEPHDLPTDQLLLL
ncbi:MAG: 5-formyltetrahydrofolate cyclo-ligase [Chlamydiia bacterium]|nr:5-formyltetrahydrofolate cyclo-ligase [Chlamydiia bacterium]